MLFNPVADIVCAGHPRPSRDDEKLQREIFLEWSKHVENWLRDGGDDFREGVEEWREVFIKQMLACDIYFHEDPLEIARDIERNLCYDIDYAFVELCDRLCDIARRSEYKAIENWVKETGIQPHLKPGDKAIYKKPTVFKGQITDFPVIIEEVDSKMARFIVTGDGENEEEDVRKDHRDPNRIRRRYVPFEHVFARGEHGEARTAANEGNETAG